MASRWSASPSILLLIVALSLAAIVITRPGEPARRLVSRWQPDTVVTRPDQHNAGVAPAPLTGPVVAAGALDLAVDNGLYPDQEQALAGEVQQALAYVVARFGTAPRERFTAAIQTDAGCGIHGLAYTDARQLYTYTCNEIDRRRAVNIMAHEIVHQLAHDRYGDAHLSADLILLEGVATWGAGTYWLGAQPDFRSYVRAQRQAGIAYSLVTHYNGLGIAAMNALYYQWASFVEYLIGAYGRDKFDQLYISGHSDPGSADYAGVYGKDIDTLEREWIAWVEG
jgi:hypothetical protein